MSKKYPNYHPALDYEGCPVCRHEKRDLIESLYIRWKHMTQLARTFDVPYEWIRKHVEALNLRKKRMANRRDLISRLVEEGVESLDFSQLKEGEKAQLIRQLIKHEDVVDGLVVHRVQNERPKLVTIKASPSPGMQKELPKSEQSPPALEADFQKADDEA